MKKYQEESGHLTLAPDDLLNLWELHKMYLHNSNSDQELTAADQYFEALYQYDQAMDDAELNGRHHTSVAKCERLGSNLRRISAQLGGQIEGLDENGRWPKDGEQYQRSLLRRDYRALVSSVKELHRLVVAKSFEIIRLDQGRHVGMKQAEKIGEGLRRTNKNIKTQIEKVNEIAGRWAEFRRFTNTSWEAVARPNGTFWVGYEAWLAEKGQRVLSPNELIAVRHLLYLRRSREELEILEAEVYRSYKKIRARVIALEDCIRRAETNLAERLDHTSKEMEMIRGQMAVYNTQLSKATAQLKDFESRFPEGHIQMERVTEMDNVEDVVYVASDEFDDVEDEINAVEEEDLELD